MSPRARGVQGGEEARTGTAAPAQATRGLLTGGVRVEAEQHPSLLGRRFPLRARMRQCLWPP